MEVTAKLRGAAISAQKVRLVADEVRGKPIERALDILTFSNKKAAKLVKKCLESAIANAEHNNGLDIDTLRVSTIYVDEGITLNASCHVPKVALTVSASVLVTSQLR